MPQLLLGGEDGESMREDGPRSADGGRVVTE